MTHDTLTKFNSQNIIIKALFDFYADHGIFTTFVASRRLLININSILRAYFFKLSNKYVLQNFFQIMCKIFLERTLI